MEKDLSTTIFRTDALGCDVYDDPIPDEVTHYAITRLIEVPDFVSEIYYNPKDGNFYKIVANQFCLWNTRFPWPRKNKKSIKEVIKEKLRKQFAFPTIV